MSSVLSIEEIKSQFPDEWILIGDPQTTRAPVLLGGSVLWHSVDRDEVYQKAIELRPAKGPTNVAFFYTGKVPQEGVEFAL